MSKYKSKNWCWKDSLESLFECYHNGVKHYVWIGHDTGMGHLLSVDELNEAIKDGAVIEENPESDEYNEAMNKIFSKTMIGKPDQGGEAATADPFFFVVDAYDGKSWDMDISTALATAADVAGFDKLGPTPEEDLPDDIGGVTIKLPQKYDPKLSNTERTADELSDMMKTALGKDDRPNCISLLFHGVPGTGKTIAAAYLAKQLNRPMRSYNIAEMLGKYVGESEKALTKAFTDCQNHGVILHLDEIDSIAANRDEADRQHQVQMVNCLLQNLDTFEGIFIATTNLQSKLDSAVTRRFLLKQEFKNVSAAQAQSLARLYFSRKAPRNLPENVLAPADFNIVKAGLLFAKDEDINRKYLYAKLMEEAELRNGKDLSIKKQTMGFL